MRLVRFSSSLKPIPEEKQLLEAGQVPQLDRDRTAQPIQVEIQPRDSTVHVRANTEPFREGLVAQPVRVARPVHTVGRVVERHQRLAVLRVGVSAGQKKEEGSEDEGSALATVMVVGHGVTAPRPTGGAWLFGRGGLKIQAVGTALGSHYESHRTRPFLASFFRAIHDFFQSPYRSERKTAHATPAHELALAVY